MDLYYFLGNVQDLRDVTARVIGSWTDDLPGWAWVQGIYAFGLEEAGHYRRAETAARNALERNPRDIYASHALAHVFEMEGRQEEGIAFLGGTVDDWKDSYFANHNWVHKALYHIEVGDFDALLPLYDDQIRGERPMRWVPLVDCAAVLWRLMLFGVDVRERAQVLVDGRPGPAELTGVRVQRLARADDLRAGRPCGSRRAGARGQRACAARTRRTTRCCSEPDSICWQGSRHSAARITRRPSTG